jgi:hypothetical protein
MCLRGGATCVICPYTLFPAYIHRHTNPSCHRASILSSIHYCCAAKHSAQALMSRHGTCHLPLLQMDATVAKCRTQHLISPKNGTRRCVCCRRVGKKYDTYRADATAMPGPATRTTGQIRAAHLQGRIRMCRSGIHALRTWSHQQYQYRDPLFPPTSHGQAGFRFRRCGQRRLTINAASGLLASGTHGSQPHAHEDEEKASAVGHQSRWPDVWQTEGYALPLYSLFLLQAYSVRADQDATTSTPLTFVRSSAPGLFRAAQNPDNGTLHASPPLQLVHSMMVT